MENKTVDLEKTYLGIELGSTRIKAVLIDERYAPIANGAYEWENRLENGYWTYALDEIHSGIRGCFASLAADVREKLGVELTTVGAMGVSGMMHGYLAFDAAGELLVPFRTWRNTTTERAASLLTKEFQFNIPQRWSIAHLYQAMLNGEEHVPNVASITTLAGYIHYRLTGKREMGVGEASGMFPITGADYDADMLKKFDRIASDMGYSWKISEALPKVMVAGEKGASLTEDGARFLDPTGTFRPGVPVCPPEGDAGTGMVATNAVAPKTGNVSAGTSIFSMLVLEKPLSHIYPEIDMVTTPDGSPVAMVHCNNCSSELDAWVKIFGEFAALAGAPMDKSTLYETLYRHAATGDADCGGVVTYNYLSGEPVTGVETGAPMIFRTPNSRMNLANFMLAQLYASMAALKMGMDLLFENEKVNAEKIQGHGGLFKVRGVAQQILANALNTPVSVMETAGEGGAWGMALLAAYMMKGDGRSLGDWLAEQVFASMSASTLSPEADGVAGFAEYIKRFRTALDAEKTLGEVI